MVTDPAAANGLSVPVKVQVSVPLAVAGQPASAGALTVQVPAASVSVTTTPVAAPPPMLLTVTVKVAVPPALIGPLPDFTTCTSGQLTVIEADASLLLRAVGASFVAATCTLLVSRPQSAAVLARERVMVTDPAAANGLSVPVKVQVSVPLAVAGHPASTGALTVQVPAGSVSVTTTPVAAPAPMLLTVTVKVAVLPALIGPLPDFTPFTSAPLFRSEADASLLLRAVGASF